MRLVIAEKPSVAKSLATVLGAATRKDGYLEGNGWLVSWCLGHLAGLADAATYNPDYAKWRYDDLPILPETWRFTIAKDKRDQFDVLRTLLRREDVTEVVNACDAGREGELIFRTVYCLAGCQKPMKRLWISSMEDSAIREGFAHLRPGADYDGLHQAALCRAKADWLVGINATRLFSVLYHRTLNIGRVMSPTLALIVQREAEIDAFKPVPFYTVALDLPGFTAASARMDKKADAEQLKNACQSGTVTVKQVARRDKSEKPPALYDLTTLQRDANRLLGFTAQQTLDYLQNLYEKKLCTYPRTDSRYLTSDMAEGLPELAEGQELPVAGAAVKEGKTTPPKHFTEDTLLSAMETAGAKDMPEDAERKGLGTPATRAGILEKLVSTGFLERKKSKKTVQLLPAHDAISLITVLPEQLQSPLLTAEWEYRLGEIERGELAPEDFMAEITAMLRELVGTYQVIKGSEYLFAPPREVVGKCPRCGGEIAEMQKGFFCQDKSCKFAIWKNSKWWAAKRKQPTKAIVAALLKDGRARVTGLYSEKSGKTYDATVVLEDTGQYVNFKLEFDRQKGGGK